MAIAKITLNGTTLMDVTQNTVTADDMKSGTTATAKNGQQVTGNIPNASGVSF